MENGVIIGRLLICVRKIAVLTPGRETFPILDPVLGNLSDSRKQTSVLFNWGIIQREIRKFGAEINTAVRDAIVIKKNHEVIREIIRFLMEYEKKVQKEKRKYQRQVRKGLNPEVVNKYPCNGMPPKTAGAPVP